MSLSASVQVVVDGIIAASERQDWDSALRLGERVRMMILDAVVDGDRGGLSTTAAALEVAEALLPEHQEKTSCLRVSWMLRSDASLAKLAARRIPSQSAKAAPEDSSARDRILRVLIAANDAPSVASISQASGLARETVSRLLPMLASDGLVRIRKVGRKSLSRITPQGRIAAGDRPVDVATVIRNGQHSHLDIVMTSTSIAQKRAHVLVGAHGKPQFHMMDHVVNPIWIGFAEAHEGDAGRRVEVRPPAKHDAAQMIINGVGRERAAEILA